VLSDLWAILLAGGAGRRLTALTGGIPKQFWAFRDGPTLIEDTARRIAPLAPANRRVTVVDATHDRYVLSLRYQMALGNVVYQPADRGTAAGVLLGLTTVLAAEAEAIVLITPSDHGVRDVEEFQRGILSAMALIRSGRRDNVLFGFEPAGPSVDYGWITPDPPGNRSRSLFTRVGRFSEKPGPEEAEQLYAGGSVWNTMVLVARARTLFAECERCLPHVAPIYSAALREPAHTRRRHFERHYRSLQNADFSRDVTALARDLGLYVWPRRMGWSDLGTPERLREWREGPITPRAVRKPAWSATGAA
jgi:mannose-1-phosphate guanylyltransferase